MKVTNVNVYGLENSLIASGYPMQAWVSDQMFLSPTVDDHIRASRLGGAPQGSGHDCFLKGVNVQFDIDFTIKTWTQAERYHWFDIVSSCSTMHKLKDFDLDKAYIEYVDSEIIERMIKLQKTYNEDPTKENFLRLVYSNPCGMKLTARVTTNYLQLKTIYAQRKNHRLPEWKEFCSWVKSLPMAKEIGVCE